MVDPVDTNNETNFKQELNNLINKYNIENQSNTPDFILANYLMMCLESFNNAVKGRDTFFSFDPIPKTH